MCSSVFVHLGKVLWKMVAVHFVFHNNQREYSISSSINVCDMAGLLLSVTNVKGICEQRPELILPSL